MPKEHPKVSRSEKKLNGRTTKRSGLIPGRKEPPKPPNHPPGNLKNSPFWPIFFAALPGCDPGSINPPNFQKWLDFHEKNPKLEFHRWVKVGNNGVDFFSYWAILNLKVK
jgi:hypothetical protein